MCSDISCYVLSGIGVVFFKQNTAYEMRISDWSSDVCSSDLAKPSDAQIAHIAYTAGQIDIDAGKQALAKSKNPTVRAFAEEMVRDHGAVNDKALALVKQLGVTPEANATSSALTAPATKKQIGRAHV